MARLSSGIHFGMMDVEVDVSFQLDFRSITDEGECMIEFEDKAEIWVTSKMKVKCQILARPGIVLLQERTSLVIKVRSSSDVTSILTLRFQADLLVEGFL
ncbi:G-Rich Sequence Factor 1 [Manis pentadactyla]|nr:G-Rich Sequence Factor 1 [Manis pentadactyla]